MYEKYVKRWIDITLSFFGLISLSWFYLAMVVAIKIDSPGPAFFTQKRVGKDKILFRIHKFRTMRIDTPHDMPTHMLENPEQYITKMGKFMRKYSIDELPQIWDIFIGNMSIIGPRPALWNQDDLITERDKYNVNDVRPGLTGWAQINGRDELEIAVKAKLDGEYVAKLKRSSFSGFIMDCRCFFGTIISVLKHEGVVEGGTGELKRAEKNHVNKEKVTVDRDVHRKILITGANSFIGTSFENWANMYYKDIFTIDTVDMIDGAWRNKDFSIYDAVFHVAGIAHADVGKVTEEQKQFYYKINRDLAVETAEKAKSEGVKQFVFMSSMIVYGDSAGLGKKKLITKETKPHPSNFYGDSKWQADKRVRKLCTADFHVAVLRPPMIYGKGSKGNYPMLAKMARNLLVFPYIDNERSMLHIDNLCEFLCQLMIDGRGGVFFPQNCEYTRTCDMVKEIADTVGHKIWITPILNPFVWIASKIPGKISGMVNKAFGNMVYVQEMSRYEGISYRVVSLKESVKRTEL